GFPKLYLRDGRPLSTASALNAPDVAKAFLTAQPQIFSLSAAEVADLRLLVNDGTGGAQFLAFNQTIDGIDVFNAQIKFTLSKDGEIIQVAGGDVAPGLSVSTTPTLSTQDAVAAAFLGLGGAQPSSFTSLPDSNGKAQFL